MLAISGCGAVPAAPTPVDRDCVNPGMNAKQQHSTQDLNQQTARVHWQELETHFARGVVIQVASDLDLVEVGRTSEGRTFYMALISSPANLERADHFRAISHRLAHPEGLSDDEARELAREGKAIVHIDGGLHATEVAHGQHTIQLAYDLVTGDDDPEIRAVVITAPSGLHCQLILQAAAAGKHIFCEKPYSHYVLRVEYRFVGEQTPGGPGSWCTAAS